VRSHISAMSKPRTSVQAERTDSTPKGWEVGVAVGVAGGRGAVVAPRDQEEEVGGERGDGGGIRSLMRRAGVERDGVRGQGLGLICRGEGLVGWSLPLVIIDWLQRYAVVSVRLIKQL